MKRRRNQARWHPTGRGGDTLEAEAAGASFIARQDRKGWTLYFLNEDTMKMDLIDTFPSFGALRDHVDLRAPEYAWFNRQVRRRAGRARNQPDIGYELRDELVATAEFCGEGGDVEGMKAILKSARKKLAADPELLADVETVVEGYFPELTEKAAPERRRPSYFSNPLGTLEKLPRAAAMWEAVYDSSQERGYSEERSAQQAWGAVKRAGYRKDKKGVWRAPNPSKKGKKAGFSVGDIVRPKASFLKSTGDYTPPINGRVERFSSLSTEEGVPFPMVLWSDANTPVAVHPGNLELDPRAKRGCNPGRRANLQIGEWVVMEVDGCIGGEVQEMDITPSDVDWDFTDALRTLQDAFTEEANRVVRGWASKHPGKAKDLVSSDDFESDDDVAWNTWAAHVGHGTGFWEHMSRKDYEDLKRAIDADDALRKATSAMEDGIHETCWDAVEAERKSRAPSRPGYFHNPSPADISGPLRLETKSDGLWVVGMGVAVPVESKREGKDLMGRLARKSNPGDTTVISFDSEDDLAEAVAVMDVALRPTRHKRPVVFRLGWSDRVILLEGAVDEPSVERAVGALEFAEIPFDVDLVPFSNPGGGGGRGGGSGGGGSSVRAAGYSFLGSVAGSVLGFGLGALVGSLAGAAGGGVAGAWVGGGLAAAAGSILGGVGGAAQGASMGAPLKYRRAAAWGGGIGIMVPYVGIFLGPLGAYLGADGALGGES